MKQFPISKVVPAKVFNLHTRDPAATGRRAGGAVRPRGLRPRAGPQRQPCQCHVPAARPPRRKRVRFHNIRRQHHARQDRLVYKYSYTFLTDVLPTHMPTVPSIPNASISTVQNRLAAATPNHHSTVAECAALQAASAEALPSSRKSVTQHDTPQRQNTDTAWNTHTT